ncbi:hypothetical protein TI05_02305 [Achromatium sp. WMS3]|nr:hypothetical protein TI05_02305 [Achromatium sp. WMS3]
MASYAMAHLKLDLLLAETGFNATSEQRFRVYLTNSLEEHHPDTGTLFASWLSQEANEANFLGLLMVWLIWVQKSWIRNGTNLALCLPNFKKY